MGEAEVAFVVEGVYEVRGRGPCVVRSREVGRAAWERGERWLVGETITDGDKDAVIVGIERFAVPPEHPAHYDGALVLRGVEMSELEVGQVWRKT